VRSRTTYRGWNRNFKRWMRRKSKGLKTVRTMLGLTRREHDKVRWLAAQVGHTGIMDAQAQRSQ
jgi:hypothetical protein